MTNIRELIRRERKPLLVYAGTALCVMAFTAFLYIFNAAYFRPFFGTINPLVAMPCIIAAGAFLLSYLTLEARCAIFKKVNLYGMAAAAGLAALFCAPVIVVDLHVQFPAEMNVAFPDSLLFYPAIGFVVEIIFHLLPLAALYFAVTRLFKKPDSGRVVMLCIPVAASIEPVYQILAFAGPYPAWTIAYIGLHVFLINLVQLLLFRRFDFITMYAFRLSYYLLWHIVWGHLRLTVLF
jgi:hypothetical protein